MKLWIGHEQEGKYMGVYTLFVSGNEITFNDIRKVLDLHPAIKQIYFGAGICSKYDIELINKCCKIYNNLMITVETRIDNLKNFSIYLLKKKNLYLIITIDDENKKLVDLDPKNVQFKIQCLKKGARLIATACLEDFILVDTKKLKSKTYVGDKIIK